MKRLFLALAVTALSASASAATLRLTAPADRAALRGGSETELAWTAAGLSAGTDEWEAFLSVDGGRYYGYRITPHLDIALQRFTFVVPNVATSSARIMIRTGAHGHETRFELPATFSIERNADVALQPAPVAPSGEAEPARDGDEPVTDWTDGDRAGTHVRKQSAAAPDQRRFDAVVADDETPPTFVEAKSFHELVAGRATSVKRPHSRRAIVRASSQLPPPDLLLVCRRRNI